MSNLLDDLFSGAVSRRTFIEIASKAGLALPMANFALAEVAAQTAPKTQKAKNSVPPISAVAAVSNGISIATGSKPVRF